MRRLADEGKPIRSNDCILQRHPESGMGPATGLVSSMAAPLQHVFHGSLEVGKKGAAASDWF
jgi:hypothetical protein